MKKKLIILIPILIVLVFVLYKSCLLLYYRDFGSYSINYDEVIIKDKDIKTDKSLANTKFENMNIYIPDGFVGKKSDEFSYILYHLSDEDENDLTTSLSISSRQLFYELEINESKRLQTIGYEKLMQKNNIKSERELIKYYYSHKEKNNLFSSRNDIKMSYLSKTVLNNSFINDKRGIINYYLLGDLDGILILEDRQRSVSFKVYNESHDEYYTIHIYKRVKKNGYVDIINDEVFDKILQSIYFD